MSVLMLAQLNVKIDRNGFYSGDHELVIVFSSMILKCDRSYDLLLPEYISYTLSLIEYDISTLGDLWEAAKSFCFYVKRLYSGEISEIADALYALLEYVEAVKKKQAEIEAKQTEI